MNRIIAAVAGVVVVVVVVLVVVFVVLPGDDEEAGGQGNSSASLPVVNTISLVTADAVVLPIQNTELSMPNSGIMDEIMVSENQAVEKGQPLARLERGKESASVAKSEADLATAVSRLDKLRAQIAIEVEDEDDARPLDLENTRVMVRDAREEFLHVSGANLQTGASVSPEGAIKEAERAKAVADARDALGQAQINLLDSMGVSSTNDIPETPESLTNKLARDVAIADARIAVLDTGEDLDDAEDFTEILKDALDDVDTARKNLESAERDVTASQVSSVENIRNAREDFQDATEDLQDVYKKWLGIVLTDDELVQSPNELFELWTLDLDILFDRRNLSYSNGIAPDASATRWNELTVYAWLFLRPDNSSITPTCEDTLGSTTAQLCIEREIDDTWETYENMRDAFARAETDGPSSVARAENAIVSAEQALQDAEDDLAQQQTDRPDLDAAVALAGLETAKAELDDLLTFPDPIDIALAEAQLADAEAELEDLLDWPDPLLVAIAKEELAKAELEVGKLERGRDPLDEERRQAQLQEAEAQVVAAEANLELAGITLADMELRAPFSGTVIAVEVDLGEEVATDTVIVRLADISRWQIETDDLDELSVVNLNEGDIVSVSFDALPDVQIQGTVVRISQFGEEKQGAITYTAEIDLNEFDDRLRWNMTASIRKETAEGVSILR